MSELTMLPIDPEEYFKNCAYVATVPKRISPAIRDFCKKLGATAPVYVDMTSASDSLYARCFLNVANHIADHGGEMQTGWAIWELPGVYLTAERHAVVKLGDRFIDVTPQPDGQRRCLFAATADSPEQSTPSRYMPLADHSLIHRFVALSSRNQDILCRGQFGSFEFRRNDAEAAQCIHKYLAIVARRKTRRRSHDARRAKRKAERLRRRRSRT